jgi:hypothetical protein
MEGSNMTVYEQEGFRVFKDSKCDLDATVRIGKTYKYLYRGQLTFEEKFTERYGRQVIICVHLPKGKFPVLERTDYSIDYPRIEILVPEVVARSMRLIK